VDVRSQHNGPSEPRGDPHRLTVRDAFIAASDAYDAASQATWVYTARGDAEPYTEAGLDAHTAAMDALAAAFDALATAFAALSPADRLSGLALAYYQASCAIYTQAAAAYSNAASCAVTTALRNQLQAAKDELEALRLEARAQNPAEANPAAVKARAAILKVKATEDTTAAKTLEEKARRGEAGAEMFLAKVRLAAAEAQKVGSPVQPRSVVQVQPGPGKAAETSRGRETKCPTCKEQFEAPAFDATVSCPACGKKFNPMKELCASAWEDTQTPEFQARFLEHVIEENKSITHADFVTGMRAKVLGFACTGQPIQLVRGARKAVFNLLAILYQVGPLVLVPLWAYHEGVWWLLAGIAVSWVAAARTARNPAVVLKGKTTGGFLALLCIVLWLSLGIHNWLTFFCLCAMWGCLFFQMAEAAERDYATQCLLESPELFAWAMRRGMIMITRRWDKPPYEDWQDGEPERAIADCTSAIRLGLRWPGMYLDRGRARAAKGEHDEAIADYTEAIRLDPKDYAAHEWRGMAYKAKGEDEKAALDVDEFKRLMQEAGARLQQGGRGPAGEWAAGANSGQPGLPD
jgi:tetratricopeptide (TPR) repeat protein